MYNKLILLNEWIYVCYDCVFTWIQDGVNYPVKPIQTEDPLQPVCRLADVELTALAACN